MCTYILDLYINIDLYKQISDVKDNLLTVLIEGQFLFMLKY